MVTPLDPSSSSLEQALARGLYLALAGVVLTSAVSLVFSSAGVGAAWLLVHDAEGLRVFTSVERILALLQLAGEALVLVVFIRQPLRPGALMPGSYGIPALLCGLSVTLWLGSTAVGTFRGLVLAHRLAPSDYGSFLLSVQWLGPSIALGRGVVLGVVLLLAFHRWRRA